MSTNGKIVINSKFSMWTQFANFMMIAIIKTIIFHLIYLVNGNWGTWQDWISCSVTCGSGSRSRYKECNTPEPAHGVSNCQRNDTEFESCSMKLCPGKF
jgi:hypothetical protein